MAASVWVEKVRRDEMTVGLRVVWRNETRPYRNGKQIPARGSYTVPDKESAQDLERKVRKALTLQHWYVHEPVEVQMSTLDELSLAWMQAEKADGAAESTIKVYISGWRRLRRDIRTVLKLPEGAAIPAAVLDRGLFTELLLLWREEGLSAQRMYDLRLYLHQAWRWASDEREKWPGVPAPPHNTKGILKGAPVRTTAPTAPTVTELDAICRRARDARSLDLGDIVAGMRLSGLRIGQVLGIRVEDVDLDEQVLTISNGKSKLEKAEKREVPIHRELLPILARHMEGKRPSDRLFTPARGADIRQAPTGPVRKLWEDATEAKEVRRKVWAPPSKGKARPDHAFRAGFLSALSAAGVTEGVRFFLVGHAPVTTEERNYAPPTFQQLREGIDKLPGIDWIGPDAKVRENVVQLGATK